jgi:hypothetical protein
MIVYQVAFEASDDHVVSRLDHTHAQSVVGLSFVILISLGLLFARDIAWSVLYNLCWKFLDVSPFLRWATYAISRAHFLKYSRDVGILLTFGGFDTCVCSLQYRCQSDTDPKRWRCVHGWVSRRARHFAARSPDRPTRSKSLYRLRYPAHNRNECQMYFLGINVAGA